jgi:mitogen-activated protein kinase 1/3
MYSNRENYEIYRDQIGKGAYGTVFFAKDKKTGDTRAVKKVEGVFESKVDAKCALREISILRRVDHPAIVSLVDVLEPPNDYQDVLLVFPFYRLDLHKMYAQIPAFEEWGMKSVQKLMFSLMSGLAYLHSRSIVHRDIKPQNLLVNQAFELMICDFGLARSIVTEEQAVGIRAFASPRMRGGTLLGLARPCIKRQLSTHVVTRWYRAPELLVETEDYSCGVDVWSSGCILGELLQSLGVGMRGSSQIRPLFPGRGSSASGDAGGVQNDAQLKKILEMMGTPTLAQLDGYGDLRIKRVLQNCAPSPGKDLKQLLPLADTVSVSLLKAMLHLDSSQRINAAGVLAHNFFANMNPNAKLVSGERLDGPFPDDPIALDFEFADVSVNGLRELISGEISFYTKREKRFMYAEQLAQLKSMGFGGRELNCELLCKCNGDVTRAVEKLLAPHCPPVPPDPRIFQSEALHSFPVTISFAEGGERPPNGVAMSEAREGNTVRTALRQTGLSRRRRRRLCWRRPSVFGH